MRTHQNIFFLLNIVQKKQKNLENILEQILKETKRDFVCGNTLHLLDNVLNNIQHKGAQLLDELCEKYL